jgi:hypothetical protein
MCYKQRAVKSTAKSSLEAEASTLLSARPLASGPAQVVSDDAPLQALAAGDDISRYCPVCSQRLISRRCKLICTVCGYYMSCADYY